MTRQVDRWVQLEQPRLGARVTFATDEFFGAKERLIDPAEPVFVADMLENPNHTNYDRNRRAGEFVVIARGKGTEVALVVVLNWFEEVRQRMGRGR